jgi:hypothetical protein
MENQDAFLPLAEKWHPHPAARALESSVWAQGATSA